MEPSSLKHTLASPCDSACPIAELHAETLALIGLYPLLAWGQEDFHMLNDTQYFKEGQGAWLAVWAQRQAHDTYTIPSETLERDRSIFRAIMSETETPNILDTMYPSFFNGLGKLERMRIHDWHSALIDKALDIKLTTPIPLLPLNLMFLFDSAFINDKGGGFDEIRPEPYLPPLNTVAASIETPPEILNYFCYSLDTNIRYRAANNPNCPEEGKVAYGLHGDKAHTGYRV